MVNTGVLLREINERIIQVGRTDGAIAQRICGLVFLIGKLPREAGADIGVRATKDHVADLLIDDLSADNGKLRSEVEDRLKRLSDHGVLMMVGDEYSLQTREGSEWDREFRNRQTKLNNDDAAIQFKRDQLLYGEIDKTVRAIRSSRARQRSRASSWSIGNRPRLLSMAAASQSGSATAGLRGKRRPRRSALGQH